MRHSNTRTPAPQPDPNDPLALAPLFAGGGEPWLPVLKPVIEAQPSAAAFIGPKRGPQIVPTRELTFQALKPNSPGQWKVVVFGQNPSPRVESATGIALFDNTFHDWSDSQFGRVIAIRCVIKAAAMWKYKAPKKTPIADIRALLKRHDTVRPPEWFQAMLAQGVLLLNAALTASSDGGIAADRHAGFWRPVVEKIVEEILRAKQAAPEKDRGIVFAWWGSPARSLKEVVQRLQRKYPEAKVRHIDHCNPAAQGDLFCDGDHFAAVNAALAGLGADEIDWLPSKGWNKTPAAATAESADHPDAFIATPLELHKLYLERLQGVKDEGEADLPEMTGVFDAPLVDFRGATAPVARLLPKLEGYVGRALEVGRARAKIAPGGMTADEIAAVYLYTCESAFSRQINAALRDPDRTRLAPYLPYLRLFFSAVARLPARRESLWRGVSIDLRGRYQPGQTVTWWGVSSCTAKLSVALGFLGSRGRRTLFEVTPHRAVGIRALSAFTGEEEFLLPPGTRLEVTDVKADRGGLCTVKLTELRNQRLVA